ncbi:MAG: ATP-binding protein [Planctomycetes bacterium]|nr:ATP-binding protein [Planctomycetota bacterium]
MHSLKIGNVVRVEAGRVEVLLSIRDLDLEHEGRNYRVGQLGSYVTIPLPDRLLVGFVTAAGRDEASAAEPEPHVVVRVQLLGQIKSGQFTRGVHESPIVGDDVWVAVQQDFEAIFGSFDQLLAGGGQAKSFTLGRFSMNTDFEVKVLGSEFFNKHVAILGNSGAGKSCTTAKILQEVLKLPEAQVVLFDMHGEYRPAFSDDQGQMDPNVTYLGSDDLVLPYWLLKYEELETLLVDPSNPLNVSAQVSFLRGAILDFKRDAAEELGLDRELTLDTPIYFSLERLKSYAENLNEARYVLNSDQFALQKLALRSLPADEQLQIMRRQRCQFNKGNPEGEVPHPLYFGKLAGLIDSIDTRLLDRRYEFLLRPIEHAQHSPYFSEQLTAKSTAGQMSQAMHHLIRLLTGRVQPRSNLTIIDLSGIPFDVVDVTVAVITRLLFDLNFWTPAHQRHPILLAYEEAHNYIPRVAQEGRNFAKTAVERVAKEGRKYGVAALLISQRPSELSETVLAQCNSMVVMRLNNPDDQAYIARVVSDHFASLIDMLPILRRGEGFVIGEAVLMPLRTLIELPARTPRSGDVDFFAIWSGERSEVDIDEVIDHWWRQDRQILNRLPDSANDAVADTVAESETVALSSQPPGPTAVPARPLRAAPARAAAAQKRGFKLVP